VDAGGGEEDACSGRAVDDDVVSMSSIGDVSSRRTEVDEEVLVEGCAKGAERIGLDDGKAPMGVVAVDVSERFVASEGLEVRSRGVVLVSKEVCAISSDML